MKSPEISVVIPFYNEEKFIAESVRSVLDQSFGDLELILVNDGSTDGSYETCRSFTDPRIKIISQENRGVAAARNTGVLNARGEYVAFLDANDLWKDNKLETQLTYMSKSPAIGINYCFSEFITESGKSLEAYQAIGLDRNVARQLLLKNPFGNGSTVLIKKKVLDEIKLSPTGANRSSECFFDESLKRAEDIDLWFRIAVCTRWQFQCVPFVLVKYRMTECSLSVDTKMTETAVLNFLAKAKKIAPDLLKTNEKNVMAYSLIYLAGNLVRRGEKNKYNALKLFNRGIRISPIMFWKRPLWVVFTFVSVYVGLIFKGSSYGLFIKSLYRMVGRVQRFAFWLRRFQHMGSKNI